MNSLSLFNVQVQKSCLQCFRVFWFIDTIRFYFFSFPLDLLVGTLAIHAPPFPFLRGRLVSVRAASFLEYDLSLHNGAYISSFSRFFDLVFLCSPSLSVIVNVLSVCFVAHVSCVSHIIPHTFPSHLYNPYLSRNSLAFP